MATERMTVSEAIVRFLVAQHIEDERDGTTKPLIPGVYAIFGHGNALGLGEALEKHRDKIRTIRGQNEEGMALAAVAYAKAARRRQVMAVTTSVGPGALNTVPAAGVAMANRLPLLLRQALRLPEFRTQAVRMGKVARISAETSRCAGSRAVRRRCAPPRCARPGRREGRRGSTTRPCRGARAPRRRWRRGRRAGPSRFRCLLLVRPRRAVEDASSRSAAAE